VLATRRPNGADSCHLASFRPSVYKQTEYRPRWVDGTVNGLRTAVPPRESTRFVGALSADQPIVAVLALRYWSLPGDSVKGLLNRDRSERRMSLESLGAVDHRRQLVVAAARRLLLFLTFSPDGLGLVYAHTHTHTCTHVRMQADMQQTLPGVREISQ